METTAEGAKQRNNSSSGDRWAVIADKGTTLYEPLATGRPGEDSGHVTGLAVYVLGAFRGALCSRHTGHDGALPDA